MELIHIQQTTIGQGAVNSVTARELHSRLGVKTKFADWIKRAIDKYSFEENEDYTVLKNGNGNNAFLEYFVTLDMAKELCMLDDGEKGKQFRKYFIECEKKATNQLTAIEQIALLARGTTELAETVHKNTVDIEVLKNDICLSSAQKRQLQISVNCKVASFNPDDTQKRKLYKKIWRKLYDKYAVASYMEIPRLKFEEAKNLIDSLTLLDMAVA